MKVAQYQRIRLSRLKWIGTGLDHLQSLKCLYLHENRIEEISVSKSFKFLHDTPFSRVSLSQYFFPRIPILILIQGSLKSGCPVKPEPVEQLHHSPSPTLLSAQSSHAQHCQVGNLDMTKKESIWRLFAATDCRRGMMCESFPAAMPSQSSTSHTTYLRIQRSTFAFFRENQRP